MKLDFSYCCNMRCSLRVVCARAHERKVGDAGVVKFYHPIKVVDGGVSCSEFVKGERKH